MPPEPLSVAFVVIDVLESLPVDWMIGGSIASSLLGEPRSTADVDIVANLSPCHASHLVDPLRSAFIIDRDTVEHAIRRRSSFNVIHIASAAKVDVFTLPDSDFHRSALARRRRIDVEVGAPRSLFVPTPEDLVLQKLDWYRQGGGVSERQWRDVLGILKVQSTRLDRSHLSRWGAELALGPLLARALAEAGFVDPPA